MPAPVAGDRTTRPSLESATTIDRLRPLAVGLYTRARPLAVGLGTLAAVAALGVDEGVVLCPYRRCTGGDCPLCGGTRSAATLFRGDVAGSWARHPLVPILAAQAVVMAVVAAVAGRAGRPIASLRPTLQRILLADLALAMAIWAFRLSTGAAAGPVHLRLPF